MEVVKSAKITVLSMGYQVRDLRHPPELFNSSFFKYPSLCDWVRHQVVLKEVFISHVDRIVSC